MIDKKWKDMSPIYIDPEDKEWLAKQGRKGDSYAKLFKRLREMVEMPIKVE